MVAGLVLVDLLVAAGGGGRLFTRAGIEAQRRSNASSRSFSLKKTSSAFFSSLK